MTGKKDSLLMWFVLMHITFTVILLTICGVTSYIFQSRIAADADSIRSLIIANTFIQVGLLALAQLCGLMLMPAFLRQWIYAERPVGRPGAVREEGAPGTNEQPGRDPLTGIRGRSAYEAEVEKLARKMEEGLTAFGIGFVDLNFLERINETYGQDRGDTAIRTICHLVCESFAHSPVFRIDGDEFGIILIGNDYEHIEELVDRFNTDLDTLASCKELEPWEAVSAAMGYALYDPETDSDVESVIDRAEENLKERKSVIHADDD